MILLDTNVVSEAMRPAPHTNVMKWIGGQDTEHIWFSAVSAAEVRFGLALLPDGRRRRQLVERFETFLDLGFGERVLPFDGAAAANYAEIMAGRRRGGRPMQAVDGLIAAIALTRGLALATRNTSDFADTGLEIIDPWDAAA